MHRSALLLLALLGLAIPAVAADKPPRAQLDDGSSLPGSDTSSPSELALIPAFPGSRALQLRYEGELLPGAALEDRGAVTMFRSGLRARAAAPVSSRLTLQLTSRYSVTDYAFDGKQDFFDGRREIASDPFGLMQDLSLNLQGAFELNPHGGHLLFERERWSLLVELFGASRWEADAFAGGLLGGGGVALGYEFPGRLKLALGMSVRSQLAERGASIDPVFSVRWRITKRISVQSRGRGGEIEYEWNRDFRTYVTAFRSGQSWRLERRRGVPGNTILSDQQLRCGLGLEWRPHDQLRVHLEIGAIATRSLEVDVRGQGTLSEIDGKPSAYLVFALEFRP